MPEEAPRDWSDLVRGTGRAAGKPARAARGEDAGRRARWTVVATLALLSVVLGVVGFRTAEKPLGWTETAYQTLRLFTLEGPLDKSLDLPLEIARFLAPLATASTAIAALLEVLARLHRARLRRVAGHAVVCGAGATGAHLARDLLREGRRVVVVELDPAAQETEGLVAAGAVVLPGDATDARVLSRARAADADVLIATCGDDATNAEVAVQAFRLVGESADAGGRPEERRLRAFVHVADPDLRALLRRRDVLNDPTDAFELRVFHLHENAARLLMVDGLSRSLARRRGSDEPAHLVIVGFGPAGEAVLLEAVRMPHRATEGSLRATLVDEDGERRLESLKRRHPGIEAGCRLHVEPSRIDDAGRLDPVLAALDAREPVSAVVLCLDDRRLAVACVLAIAPRCATAGIPVFVRLEGDRGLATLVRAGSTSAPPRTGDVRPFGSLASAGSADAVLDETLDALARAIHDAYVAGERARGRTPETNPSMVDWSVLPETLRDSNRRQADHVPFKLAAVGRWAAPAEVAGPEAPFTEEEVERLAALEHARWNADRRLEGWTYAPGKKDVAKRTTPYLVAYEALPDDVKAYDREAVRGIPAFLGARGLRIVRAAGTPPPA